MTDEQLVRDFWQASSCGEIYAVGEDLRSRLESQASLRYSLEPYIETFANFDEAKGEDVLEIGVGMGADHVRLAQAGPRRLHGIDLTSRAVEWTAKRLATYGFESDLRVADAERLPFDDEQFSLVYSWGVLHHSPDTRSAISEVHRVLRPGGRAKVMIYHRPSIVGAMLWLRYGLLKGKPRTSLTSLFATRMESPGTKAYTVDEARSLFSEFSSVDVRVQLSFADLLEGQVGQQHAGPMLAMAKRLWPRRSIRRWLGSRGLYLLIEVAK